MCKDGFFFIKAIAPGNDQSFGVKKPAMFFCIVFIQTIIYEVFYDQIPYTQTGSSGTEEKNFLFR